MIILIHKEEKFIIFVNTNLGHSFLEAFESKMSGNVYNKLSNSAFFVKKTNQNFYVSVSETKIHSK